MFDKEITLNPGEALDVRSLGGRDRLAVYCSELPAGKLRVNGPTKLSRGEKILVLSEDESSQLTVSCQDTGKLVIHSPKNLGKRKRLSILDYLNSLEDNNECKKGLIRLYRDYRNRFDVMCAGARIHHSQVGGLVAHTLQVIEIALNLFELRKNLLASEVSRDDIIIAAFLHDFSKVKMYRRLYDPQEIQRNDGREFKYDNNLKELDAETWTLQKCLEYRIPLSVAQVNAIHYAEGGFATWVKQRHQPEWTKLGVLISCADIYSAKIYNK